MFEQLFGDAFVSSKDGSSSGQDENVDFLTELSEKGTVMSIYHTLLDEFQGPSSTNGEKAQNAEADGLKKAGSTHFAMQRYCDAVESYKRALELSPGEAHLYTNIALALIRCGRYEEAVAYAHGATVIQPTFPKGFALLAIAYAHLGYTDVATYYATDCMRPFGMDIGVKCEQAITNSIAGKLNPSMYRTTNGPDLQMTLNRFSDAYLNIDQLIYLFVHLDFHMSCKDQNQMMQVGGKLRQTGFIRRLFRETPITSGVISHCQDLLALPADDAHLLAACLRITGFASCGSPQACNDLLSCQEFLYFLSSSSKQIVSGNFVKAVLSNPTRYAFHQQIVDNLLRTLCTATSQGGPFNRYLRPIDPFKSFSWHVKLLGVWFSLFNPVKNADIMCHLIVSVSKICEEYQPYIDELFTLPKRDVLALFSLLATVSQIYVECALHPSVILPIQLDLLLVFWLFLTKDARSAQFCVQCPRVWTFFANRLRSVVSSINVSTLKGEVWFYLEVLCNMSAFIKKNRDVAEHCFENGPWFQQIVDAAADVCGRKSKHHVFIRSALMLASRLGSFSPKFCELFSEKVTFTRLVRLASCGEPDVDAPALHCIATLLKSKSRPEIIREITQSSHFSEYVAKTVSSITHAINPLAALGNDSKTCLFYLLDEDNGEELVKTSRDALLAALKKSSHSCDAFVKRIQGGTSPVTAGAVPEGATKSAAPKRKTRDAGMFSEPLPDDVSPDEAASLTSKLFGTLTKVNDELGTVFRTPAQ